MRDYGKVFSTFWTSDSTRSLSDDAKVLALYLLTGPHSNIIGCFRLPDGYASEDLGWGLERVSKGFGELFQKGFATREESSKWVFIHKHLKWNPLENPNQITGALKLYDQIPDTSSVKPLIAKGLREYTKPGLKGFETLPKPFGNPSKTVSKPETETETETEKRDIGSNPPDVAPTPLDPEIENFVREFQDGVKAEFTTKAPKVTDFLVRKGSETVERLIRLDGNSLEEVRRVIAWAREDEFWRNQVFSLAALREKGKNGNTKFANIAVQFEKRQGEAGLSQKYFDQFAGAI